MSETEVLPPRALPLPPTSLVLEADGEVLDAPRTLLAERFCEWLAGTEGALPPLPPGEIVIGITKGSRIGRPYARAAQNDAVGTFVAVLYGLTGPGSIERSTRWEVKTAYCEDFVDAADIESWLVTIPHELLHLSDFAIRFENRVPADVPLPLIAAAHDAADEDRVETEARRITARFVEAHPNLLADPELLKGADAYRRGRRRAGRR